MEIRQFLNLLVDLNICEIDETDDSIQYEFQISDGWARFDNKLKDLPNDVKIEYWEGDEKTSIYFILPKLTVQENG